MTSIEPDAKDYDPNCTVEGCFYGWVEVEGKATGACACRIRKLREARCKRFATKYPMPVGLVQKTFESYQPENDHQKKALEKMKSGVQCYLFGPNGTGKTHLLAASVNAKVKKLVPAILISAPWLFHGIRKDMFSEKSGNGDLVDIASEVEYLAIDDLGKEKPSGMVEEKLFMIVDRRVQQGLATSFSSELPLDHEDNAMDGAIKSRIYEMCQCVCVKGDDHRRKLAEE